MARPALATRRPINGKNDAHAGGHHQRGVAGAERRGRRLPDKIGLVPHHVWRKICPVARANKPMASESEKHLARAASEKAYISTRCFRDGRYVARVCMSAPRKWRLTMARVSQKAWYFWLGLGLPCLYCRSLERR